MSAIIVRKQFGTRGGFAMWFPTLAGEAEARIVALHPDRPDGWEFQVTAAEVRQGGTVRVEYRHGATCVRDRNPPCWELRPETGRVEIRLSAAALETALDEFGRVERRCRREEPGPRRVVRSAGKS